MLNGTFVDKDTGEIYAPPSQGGRRPMPIHNYTGGKKIQVFLNDVLLNSAIYSYHKLGIFET